MRKIIAFILYLCDIFIPKKHDQIVFSSFPDLADNSYGMFRYLYQNHRSKNSKFIWLLSAMEKEEQYKQMLVKNIGLSPSDFSQIIFSKKNSVSGLWYYFRSKYVFFTHGLYPQVRLPKKHVLINLWHGMPLKTIGKLDPDNRGIPLASYVISTSEFFKTFMSKAFDQETEDTLVTGQPRNDLLFLESDSLLKIGVDKDNYKKVFLWTPTYRQSINGDIRVDGNTTSELQVIGKDIVALNEYLQKLNAYMIIKLHPMDRLNMNRFDEYTNITFLKNNDLKEKNCQLYSLLGEVDVLLTDFSSIYIDYLLLNRPIGFIMDDFDKYENSRGFVMDKPKEYMPGQFISSKVSLFDFIDKSVNDIDEYKIAREQVNNILNIHKDSFSEYLWTTLLKRTN